MPPERHGLGPSPTRLLQGRQRSRKACDPCRHRKTKCDEGQPCTPCSTYGYDCVYRQRLTRITASVSNSSSIRARTLPQTAFGDSNISAMSTENVPEPLPQKQDNVCIAIESLKLRAGQGQLLSSMRTRYTSLHSAIVRPKLLGISLELPNPPRLHPFGWNPGLRPENMVMPQSRICNIISLGDMRRFADVYFAVIHPTFSMLDPSSFAQWSTAFWVSEMQGADFETVVCGVVALGSYFSGSSSSIAEAEVVEQGRLLLDFSIAHPPALLSISHVVAWVLRAIYLRLTTRPHISWLASCTAVHVAEAIGLHRDRRKSFSKTDRAGTICPMEDQLRGSIFWVASALNKFFASEYGRTRVDIDLITCQPFGDHPSGLTSQLVAILQSVPRQLNYPTGASDHVEAMQNIVTLPADTPFLALLRADAVFCIFRLLHSTHLELLNAQISSILTIISSALDGTELLGRLHQP